MNHSHAFQALLAFGLSTSLVTLLAQEPSSPAAHAPAAPAADVKAPAKAAAKPTVKPAAKAPETKAADVKAADSQAAGKTAVQSTGAEPANGDAAKAEPHPTVELEAAGTFAVAPGAEANALPPQGFTYHADGRRDPFVTLIKRGAETQQTTKLARAAGLAGLNTGEVTLRGILASEGQFVAMLLGADAKTYIVRTGDKLADGMIHTITADAMVIEQLMASNGPSQAKTREVRKTLRHLDGTN